LFNNDLSIVLILLLHSKLELKLLSILFNCNIMLGNQMMALNIQSKPIFILLYI